MALRPQSFVLGSAFVLAVAHLLLLGVVSGLLLFGGELPAAAMAALGGLAGSHPGGLLPASASASAILATGLAGILAACCLGLAARPLVGRLFRRTAAPELFFLMLFLASLVLEAWRAANLLFHLLPMPAAMAAAATRAVLFGRLFGLSCLLASSLYAAGLKYSHYAAAAGGTALVAFTLAAVQPVDATALATSFLYRLGDPQGYFTIWVSLAVLSVVSLLAAALIRRSTRFALAAAGAALMLAGGTWLFVRQVAVYYLWV